MKAEDIKLTLVTVCRNSEKTITKTIESLENQTDKNFIHIIIDGKSTDQTLLIIDKYKSNNRIVYSESDTGIYDAMNKGVNYSNTDYITFLNSDDYLDNYFVENINKLITFNYDYIYSAVFAVRDNSVPKLYLPPELRPNLKFQIMPFPHPGLVVKRSLFEEIGNFNLSYKYAADLDWIFRLVSSQKYLGYRNTNANIYYSIGGAGNSYLSFLESIRIYRKYHSSLIFIISKFIKGYLRLKISKIRNDFKK